jgi:branched-chain amino acid transport system ATP-binding protein
MLAVSDIRAGYSGVPVLELGRNGVGKTTLMRVLIGLLRATGGAVTLEGAPVTNLAPHAIARRGIAFVPQGRGIFAKLSVRENLMIGTRAAAGPASGLPADVFAQFPILRERLDQTGGTLSGGEQQMLAIARALAGRPKVLLLDEPSEGIQPSIVQEIGRLIQRLSGTAGMAVLLVEQNIDLALQVARRCLVMEKGRIVHEGRPQDFRDETVLRKFLAI